MARKKAQALPLPEPEKMTVYGDIVQETEAAILLVSEGEQCWLPKGQIEYAGERGDEYVEVTLPDWLAFEKGLADRQGYIAPSTVSAVESAESDTEHGAEPKTITLHGTVLGQNTETVIFLVRYGDEIGTEAEFSIPREQIASLFDESTEVEQNELVVSLAYAIEAGIIDDPDYSEVDDEAESGASPVPNDRHWLKQETITVTQELTQKEKAEYADAMALLDDEIEELEAERDRISKSLKKQIDAKEEERRGLSKIVREGDEEREIFCDKLADYNTCEMVWTDAHPPHDEVQRRKMTKEEMQPSLLEYSEKMAASAPAEEGAEPSEPADTAPDGEGVDFDAMADAEGAESDAPAEEAADPEDDAPGCTSCAHQDSGDDESCDGCGDALNNFTPVAAATEQSQGAEAVQ